MVHSASVPADVIRELVAERPGPCVSLYLTTEPPGRRSGADRIRLRHLLARAERELASHGVLEDGLEQILGPVHAAVAEEVTWSQPPSTLAFFAAPGYFRLVRGRATGAEEAVVDARFHLRPLLGLLAGPARFHVLALSEHAVRLLEVGAAGVRRVALPQVAASLDEWMGGATFYSELQAHSSGQPRLGRRGLIVHGHGDRDEEHGEDNVRHWFGQIADAIERLALDPHAPRVLAATRDHAALYAAVSHDARLLAEPLAGNPDHLSDEDLAARALPRVEAALARLREQALETWREELGGARASGDLRVVLPAAHHGLVRTLFVPAEGALWGSYDAVTEAVEVHARKHGGDEDLLERAARETLGKGGEVFALEDAGDIGGAPVAALLVHR